MNRNSMSLFLSAALLLIPLVALAQPLGTGALWTRYWDGAVRSDDSITAIVADGTGNVYVTGAGSQTGESLDFVTAKYNDLGIEQWRAYYSGSEHGDDIAIAIVLDNSGNVIVTGTSDETGPAFYVTTIKYNAVTGAEMWRRSTRPATPSTTDDAATGLAYDSVSNYLYVCGSMNGDATSEDYYLVRYDPGTGDTVWTRTWDGGDLGDDYCIGLALAGTGAARNPVLAGYYWHDVQGVYDWAIVSCSTATGAPAWVRHVEWDIGNDDEEPVGCCSDFYGNVWVTGYRWNDPLGYTCAVIAKIRSNNARLDTMTLIRGDDNGWGVKCAYANGKVYTIGSFYDAVSLGNSGEDWGVEAYDTTAIGTSRHLIMLWERYLDGGYQAFMATAHARRIKGKGETMKSNSGLLSSSLIPHPSALHARPALLSAPGRHRKSRIFDEPDARTEEKPTNLAFDAPGRLYVCGYMIQPDGDQYWHVRRFGTTPSPDTTFKLWLRRDTQETRAYAIAVRDTEHIYVGGFVSHFNPYPAWDDEQAVARFGTGFQSAVFDSLVPMPSDTVDSGYVQVAPQAFWHNNGSQVAQPTFYRTIGLAFADTGHADPLNAGQYDSVPFSQPFTFTDRGPTSYRCTLALAEDTSPNNNLVAKSVFVRVRDAEALEIIAPVGTVNRGQVITPQAILRNNGNATAIFNTRFQIGTAYVSTRACTLAAGVTDTFGFTMWTADSLGNLVTRCTTMLAGDRIPANDWVENTVFVQAYDAQTLAIIAPTGIVPQDTVVIPQATVRNNGSTVVTFEVKFDISDGYSDSQTVTALGPGAQTDVFFSAWSAAAAGTFGVRCSTRLAGDGIPDNDRLTDSVIVQPPSGAADAGLTLPRVFAFYSPRPNPAGDVTRFSYDLPAAAGQTRSVVQLGLYDLRGRLCRELVNEYEGPGRYHVTWNRNDEHNRHLPAGIYFARIRAGKYSATRKLLLIE